MKAVTRVQAMCKARISRAWAEVKASAWWKPRRKSKEACWKACITLRQSCQLKYKDLMQSTLWCKAEHITIQSYHEAMSRRCRILNLSQIFLQLLMINEYTLPRNACKGKSAPDVICNVVKPSKTNSTNHKIMMRARPSAGLVSQAHGWKLNGGPLSRFKRDQTANFYHTYH